MRVLLVNNQIQLGGAETVVHQLRSRIPNTRLLIPEGNFDGVEAMYPHLLSRLNHSRLHSFTERWFPLFAWTNRRFANLRFDSADIIHIHNFHGTYASVEALAELARAKRVVWTFHGLWGVTGGCDHPKGCRGYLEKCGGCPQLGLWPIGDVDRTSEELGRKMVALAGLRLHVIVPSRYFLEVIRSSRVGQGWVVHHIPNGIDPAKFRHVRVRSDRVRILVVNRNFQDPHKGFGMINQALNLINSTGIELTFVGVKSGWALGQLKSGFQTRDIGYVGDRETLARLYGASDIFLFASPAENFPCVILEAMASGCCVVATPSGGVVEQIADGKDGLLAADISGKSLAAALQRALDSPKEIQTLGENARSTVIERFSEDTMIDEHVCLYRSLVGNA